MDPKGLAVVTSGCDPAQDAAIQLAAQKADAAVNTCTCEPDKWKKKIRTTTYHCPSFFEQGAMGVPIDRCGQAGKPPLPTFTGKDLMLFEVAFTDQRPGLLGGCGCLQGTVLHEIAHLMGQGDPQAYRTAKKCFSCALGAP